MRLREAIRYIRTQRAAFVCNLPDISFVDREQLEEWLTELEQLRSISKKREEEFLRVCCEKPSETCKRLHIQCCQFCDDVNCGDNTNPKYAKKVALLKEIKEKAAILKAKKKEK